MRKRARLEAQGETPNGRNVRKCPKNRPDGRNAIRVRHLQQARPISLRCWLHASARWPWAAPAQEFGTMVAFAPPDIVARRLEDVVGKTRNVPPDFDLLVTARNLGVTFGD